MVKDLTTEQKNILFNDLKSGCDDGNLINCDIINYWESNFGFFESISLSDIRVKSAILLSPWNGSVLNSVISSVSIPTLVLTGDIDDTTVIFEVNNTSFQLGDNLVNYAIFNNSVDY